MCFIVVEDPNVRLTGFELDRKTWTQLNRIRSNYGHCNSLSHKWDPGISTELWSGHHSQTIHHIVDECTNRCFDGVLERLFMNKLVRKIIIYVLILNLSFGNEHCTSKI